ncbi:MAG: hypothetical protein RLZZ139_3651 [Cyanobacteriota bacterium]
MTQTQIIFNKTGFSCLYSCLQVYKETQEENGGAKRRPSLLGFFFCPKTIDGSYPCQSQTKVDFFKLGLLTQHLKEILMLPFGRSRVWQLDGRDYEYVRYSALSQLPKLHLSHLVS